MFNFVEMSRNVVSCIRSRYKMKFAIGCRFITFANVQIGSKSKMFNLTSVHKIFFHLCTLSRMKVINDKNDLI